jgi:hypothetical protein
MAGSWEILNIEQNNPRVLVATLTRELVTTAWAMHFRQLVIPHGTFTMLSGMPFDHARNTACQKLLELQWEYLFFLDDDVGCPPDTIIKLLRHKLPIVSGVYYRRNLPLAPVMLKNSPNGPQWITEYPQNSLVEVDFVGAGCLLIQRQVLESLPPLSNRCGWFQWQCDRTDLPMLEKTSEDFTFMTHARNHGYKIMVDTSIQCLHIGLSSSSIEGFKPLELKA